MAVLMCVVIPENYGFLERFEFYLQNKSKKIYTS